MRFANAGGDFSFLFYLRGILRSLFHQAYYHGLFPCLQEELLSRGGKPYFDPMGLQEIYGRIIHFAAILC